jgi:hypothetical protein
MLTTRQFQFNTVFVARPSTFKTIFLGYYYIISIYSATLYMLLLLDKQVWEYDLLWRDVLILPPLHTPATILRPSPLLPHHLRAALKGKPVYFVQGSFFFTTLHIFRGQILYDDTQGFRLFHLL